VSNSVVKKAKIYAHRQHVSLSKIVEKYLDSISTQLTSGVVSQSPITDELSGILKGVSINYKQIRNQKVQNKYL